MAIKCTRRGKKDRKEKKRPKSKGATEDEYQGAYRPCVDPQNWELIKSDVFSQQSAATTLGVLQGLTHPQNVQFSDSQAAARFYGNVK